MTDKHDENTTISLGSCPTCGGPAQFIEGGIVRHVSLRSAIEAETEARVLERVITVIRAERLSGETGTEGDVAYNVALEHAEDAIRALSPTTPTANEPQAERYVRVPVELPEDAVIAAGTVIPYSMVRKVWKTLLWALAPDTDVSTLEELIDRGQWQPIETAPKDGTTVELMNETSGLRDVGRWCDYTGHGYSIDGEWDQVKGNGEMTHWRPLPVAPKGE